MNYKMIGRIVAFILIAEAVFMIPALLISFFDHDKASLIGFLITIVLLSVTAAVLVLVCLHPKKGFFAREGFVCVGLSWIVMSFFGALPFYISGEMPNYIDALFEIVSGFTTTGASVLKDVEALSRGLIYWRSFSHWLGGMGVLVFILAVIPLSGRNEGFTMHILRAESTGPDVGKLVPRMKRTALILYVLYIVLTVLNFLFLIFGNMPVFDAICTAFGTAGTGGFGIKNDSMSGYSSYIQNVTTVFMLLFSVNFSCYYSIIVGNVRGVLKNEELRFFGVIVFLSTAAITWNVLSCFETFGEALKHAAFQVASIISTSGFSTVNFDLWPSFSKAIIIFLMAVGACAGSTGGGLKCGRVLILLKSAKRSIMKLLHPNNVQTVRVNNVSLDENIIVGTNIYFVIYIFIIAFSFLVVSLDDFSITTNFTAVLSCFNNIGPGFESVGPVSNFSDYGVLSKMVFIFDMLAGRLEIFPILLMFSRRTWTRAF